MEQNNNPLIEQFQNEFASQWDITSQESWNSLPAIAFRIAASIGWTNIIFQINSTEGVLQKNEGRQLCFFAINMMTNEIDSNTKISKHILNLGVECLKSLLEINIDNKYGAPTEQKEKEKLIGKEFLDFWKEWLKKSLEKGQKLVK